MKQVINSFYTITASSEFREIERLRAKARHDEAQALHHARNKGRIEGKQEGISEWTIEIARSMIANSEPVSKIMRYTGLTQMEIEALS